MLYIAENKIKGLEGFETFLWPVEAARLRKANQHGCISRGIAACTICFHKQADRREACWFNKKDGLE